jgi:hypothetical protein
MFDYCINANHFQMTYYLLIFLIFIGYFIYCNIKDKKQPTTLNSLAVLSIAGIFAIGANATN